MKSLIARGSLKPRTYTFKVQLQTTGPQLTYNIYLGLKAQRLSRLRQRHRYMSLTFYYHQRGLTYVHCCRPFATLAGFLCKNNYFTLFCEFRILNGIYRLGSLVSTMQVFIEYKQVKVKACRTCTCIVYFRVRRCFQWMCHTQCEFSPLFLTLH